MGKTLYLQCDSGISGDMVAGALIDLGVDEHGLRAALASLGVGGFDLVVSRKRVGSLDACDFDVVLDEACDGHDHDMEYLYGDLDDETPAHRRPHARDASHDASHGHAHDHDHVHAHDAAHDHAHVHRNLDDVLRVIDAADLSERAAGIARRVFRIVAEAEAEAHGVPVAEVHFHEVGAVDSIVDVVAVAYCLDALGVTDAYVSPLMEGTGRVRSAHGVLPVPVPAVANIVRSHGLVISQSDRQGEFVTPTGAAIAAAIGTLREPPDRYRILACGLGSGKRAYDPPSTVRALLVEPLPGQARASEASPARAQGPEACPGQPKGLVPGLWKLECEMDDCTGEDLGRALGLLMGAGAREAHFAPVFMKKNRPGYQVQVLCDASLVPRMERVLFEETTTIGVRRHRVERTALARREVRVSCELGEASVKVVELPDGRERAYPEHDAVAALARAAGVPYQEAYRAVLSAGEKVVRQ
jgi:uncharacterized protein (TIGR00299 family) protein